MRSASLAGAKGWGVGAALGVSADGVVLCACVSCGCDTGAGAGSAWHEGGGVGAAGASASAPHAKGRGAAPAFGRPLPPNPRAAAPSVRSVSTVDAAPAPPAALMATEAAAAPTVLAAPTAAAAGALPALGAYHHDITARSTWSAVDAHMCEGVCVCVSSQSMQGLQVTSMPTPCRPQRPSRCTAKKQGSPAGRRQCHRSAAFGVRWSQTRRWKVHRASQCRASLPRHRAIVLPPTAALACLALQAFRNCGGTKRLLLMAM